MLLYISLYFPVCLNYFERKRKKERERKEERKRDHAGCRMLDRLVARNNVKLNSRWGTLVVWMRKGQALDSRNT